MLLFKTWLFGTKMSKFNNVRLILYLFKELHKQASEFSSSGGWCETQNIFVSKLKLQGKIKHAVTT